eukprot:TRINITY_DN64515_c0_g1_i1.p1 TRINITY_DN64515_c0_g1~~TRINITY_DN64515_c0_g1_i1.p1  ORF type:complete len:557 (-),score=79.09 TRINITY_DN64515_c0_g1_i1:72-1691(-)
MPALASQPSDPLGSPLRPASPARESLESPALEARVQQYEQHGGRRVPSPLSPQPTSSDAYIHSKMKYRRALAGSSAQGASPQISRIPSDLLNLIHPPAHVLPPSYIIRLPFGLDDDGHGRQGSAGFIFTICTTMMGSTLLCLPWGFEHAGVIAGTLVTVGFGAVSFYTCSLILRWGASQPEQRCGDFSDLCEQYLGTCWKHAATLTSLGILFGASACNHVLMATVLQSLVVAVLPGLGAKLFCCGSGHFEYASASCIVGCFLLPFLFVRDVGKLAAVASYGVLALVYNVFFIVGGSIVDMVDLASLGSHAKPDHQVKMVGSLNDVGIFVGMMGLSLFVQSVLLPISANHARARSEPAVVRRDLSMAYLLAVIFYIAVGLGPAVAFQLGGDILPRYTDLGLRELPQNYLLAYSQSNAGALIGRFLLFLQILVTYPILGSIIRRQLYVGFLNVENPSAKAVTAFNVPMVGLTTLISSVFPNPGSVVGYVGAYTAVVYMLSLPVMVHLQALRRARLWKWYVCVGHVTLVVIGTLVVLLQFLA